MVDINSANLQKLWDEGDFLLLGEMLCNQIPNTQQPMWFSTLLEIASPYADEDGVIDTLLEVIYCEDRWFECKEIFNSLRATTLKYGKLQNPDKRRECTVILAENIAKVTFNCSKASEHGYDKDSGYWIPGCVDDLINSSKDANINKTLLDHLLMRR